MEGRDPRHGRAPRGPPLPPAHAGPCSPSPRGAWEGWQGAAEERAALQAFRREENHFFALFFPVRRPSTFCERRDLKGLSAGAAGPGSGAEGRFGVAGSVPWS